MAFWYFEEGVAASNQAIDWANANAANYLATTYNNGYAVRALSLDSVDGGPAQSLLTLQNVPDGGITLMLLGGALVGLGALRRKVRR
jgi:hypothetical protein